MIAVRTRRLDATVSATLSASAFVSAPVTRTASERSKPSPSQTIILARSHATSRKAIASAASSHGPAAPVAKANTESFVLVSPSTEMRW